MHKKTIPIITLDGPGASGKGSIARLLAHYFDYYLLDSGAVYRTLAIELAQLNIQSPSIDDIFIAKSDNNPDLKKLLHAKKLTDQGKILKTACLIAQDLKVSFKINIDDKQQIQTQVYLNAKEISEKIRSNQAAKLASNWAVFKAIRQSLYHKFRSILIEPNIKGLVADGRDMGSVVFKNANVKLFISADLQIRVQRRAKELRIENDNHKISTLMQSMAKRDEQDSNRSTAPLKILVDSIVIDTSKLNLDQAFQLSLKIAKEKLTPFFNETKLL